MVQLLFAMMTAIEKEFNLLRDACQGKKQECKKKFVMKKVEQNDKKMGNTKDVEFLMRRVHKKAVIEVINTERMSSASNDNYRRSDFFTIILEKINLQNENQKQLKSESNKITNQLKR